MDKGGENGGERGEENFPLTHSHTHIVNMFKQLES